MKNQRFALSFLPGRPGVALAVLALALGAPGARPASAVQECSGSITVVNDGESGAGSLRQAIADLCPGGTITFAKPFFDKARTITLASSLAITKDLTIDGSAVAVAPSIGHNSALTVFDASSGSYQVTLTGLTIVDGMTGIFYYSSGAKSLTVRNCTFAFNSPGGAIYVLGGSLAVEESTFTGNHADEGGAIYLQASGASVIRDSTFVGNGANVNGGALSVRSLATVTNCTFTGNAAGQGGGGLANTSSVVTVNNSTFSGNTAAFYGAQVYGSSGAIHLYNTILANSVYGKDCETVNEGTVDGANDLIEGSWGNCAGGITNLVAGKSPLLGTLGNYGGRTQTLPLLPGSPAIDAGDGTTCANATTVDSLDQRGTARPAACDIGAFESQGFTLTKTGGDNQSTPVTTAFTNPLTLEVTTAVAGGVEPVDGGVVTFTGPDSGPGTSPSVVTATIAVGAVSRSVTANGTVGGPYTLTASAAGAEGVDFSLTNEALPNVAPTDISLNNSTVLESQPAGTLVGTLGTTDANPGDTFVYSFTCETPGADDASFAIDGSDLVTAAVFDYDSRGSYAICVRSTDAGGLAYDEHFMISVTDAFAELVANGGFEEYNAPTATVPNGWSARRFGWIDGRSTVRREGAYAVKLTGNGTTKTLTQALAGGPAGDLTLSYWVKGRSLASGGTCRAQVVFTTVGGTTVTRTLPCPTKATFSWRKMMLGLSMPEDFAQAVLTMRLKKASGTVWLDEVSLTR